MEYSLVRFKDQHLLCEYYKLELRDFSSQASRMKEEPDKTDT